jgi:hypothetical protein
VWVCAPNVNSTKNADGATIPYPTVDPKFPRPHDETHHSESSLKFPVRYIPVPSLIKAYRRLPPDTCRSRSHWKWPSTPPDCLQWPQSLCGVGSKGRRHSLKIDCRPLNHHTKQPHFCVYRLTTESCEASQSSWRCSTSFNSISSTAGSTPTPTWEL